MDYLTVPIKVILSLEPYTNFAVKICSFYMTYLFPQ